jgi:hypothetical protein
VTREDAADAIALVKFATSEFYIQSSRVAAVGGAVGTSSGRGAQLKRFVTELQAIACRTSERAFSEQQLKQLHATLQLSLPFHELIDALNHNGFLLRKNAAYKLLGQH